MRIPGSRVPERDKLQSYLQNRGISTAIHCPVALPFLKAYNYLKHSPEDFPVSYKYQSEILSLPIFPELKEEEIIYVCDNIATFLNKNSVQISLCR